MQIISKQEFDKKIQQDAKKVHNQFLRMGTFWPLDICKKEARKKLLTQYKINRP